MWVDQSQSFPARKRPDSDHRMWKSGSQLPRPLWPQHVGHNQRSSSTRPWRPTSPPHTRHSAAMNRSARSRCGPSPPKRSVRRMAGWDPLDMRTARLMPASDNRTAPSSNVRGAPRGEAASPSRSKAVAHWGGNLLVLSVFAGLQLAVDQIAIDDDLKRPARRGDQTKTLDVRLEFVEQFVNHAHGTVSIASNGAVLQGDIHGRHRNSLVLSH